MKRKLPAIATLAVAAAVVLVLPAAAFAQDGSGSGHLTAAALAAGFGLGIAAFGGALGQAKVASSALEGISRNPGASGNMFLPFILGMVLIESLVIYALVIGFNLAGKIPGV